MSISRSFSKSRWETQIGYCRAIRVGQQFFVSGTTATADDGGVYAPGDGYAQARRCFEIIQAALAELEATLADVVRTRIFVTDIDRWEEFGRAHAEFFGEHPPAAAMVQVARLIDLEQLIEVEVEAVVAGGSA